MILSPENLGFNLTTDDWIIVHTKAGGIISAPVASFDITAISITAPNGTAHVFPWDTVDHIVKAD